MLPVRSRGPQLSHSRAAIVRRSKCCSHILSAFCGSADCDCADPAVHSSNSRWQRLLRTSGGSPSLWFGHHRRRPWYALRERSLQCVAWLPPTTIGTSLVLNPTPHPTSPHLSLLQQNRPIATLPQEFMSAMPPKADKPELTRMTLAA